MGAGYRNGFAEFVTDDIFGEFTGDSGGNMVSSYRSRRKNKKRRVSTRRPSKRHNKRTVKHSRKSRKGGKRPYPTWLKKYWFKKKHK